MAVKKKVAAKKAPSKRQTVTKKAPAKKRTPLKRSKKKVAKKKAATRKKRKPLKVTDGPGSGRLCSLTKELGLEICARMVSGRSLRDVCTDDDMPTKSTVFIWLAKGDLTGNSDKYQIFRDQYARACTLRREYRFEQLEHEVTEHALTPILDQDGKPVMLDGKVLRGMTAQSVQFARLMMDTFKWQAAKEEPKKYGEKVDVNHGGQADNPIEVLRKEISGRTIPINTRGTVEEERDDE